MPLPWDQDIGLIIRSWSYVGSTLPISLFLSWGLDCHGLFREEGRGLRLDVPGNNRLKPFRLARSVSIVCNDPPNDGQVEGDHRDRDKVCHWLGPCV
jgi:hypothetical protein